MCCPAGAEAPAAGAGRLAPLARRYRPPRGGSCKIGLRAPVEGQSPDTGEAAPLEAPYPTGSKSPIDTLLLKSRCESAIHARHPLPQRQQPAGGHEGVVNPFASPVIRSRSSEPLRAFGGGRKTRATLTVMHDTRDLTKHLAELLRHEHGALADFLVALADFDRDRRWVELGHTSLFYFLHRELGLSKGAAFYRKTAAELIQRYPEVVEPLRDGRLCITSVVELAKVITPENRGEVVARFFHTSKQEAKAVAAELRPAEAAPHRDVVTVPALAAPAKAVTRLEVAACHATPGTLVQPDELRGEAPSSPRPPAPLPAARPDEVEPLTGDLRRFHTTVSKRFLDKLAAARDALSHSHPGADTETVLEAALDLLLAANDKKKGIVKKPGRARRAPPLARGTSRQT